MPLAPKLAPWYVRPQADLWQAFFIEAAHYGLWLPRKVLSNLPEELVHLLSRYFYGKISHIELAYTLRELPVYANTTDLDPVWRQRTRSANLHRDTEGSRGHRYEPDGPANYADGLFRCPHNPTDDELIPYRLHRMPSGIDEFVFVPRVWLHCWTHHGKWPAEYNITPWYSTEWKTRQRQWIADGMKWPLPARLPDIKYSQGLNHLRPRIGDTLDHAKQELLQLLPGTPANAMRPQDCVDRLRQLEYSIDTSILATGLVVQRARVPYVHLTEDGRLFRSAKVVLRDARQAVVEYPNEYES